MKPILTIIASILIATSSIAQIVVDFANATLNDTSFMAGGVEWKMTGDFLISEYENFDCGENLAINRYMDTGYTVGQNGSYGILGSIAPMDPGVTFQMGDNLCGWPGSHDGEFTSNGTFKFLGVKPDGSTIEENITLTSINYNDLISFNLSASIWDGIDLVSLQIEIVWTSDSTDYLIIDNLTFDAINVPTSVKTIEEMGGNLYPNPTKGIINLQDVDADEIQVFDNLGRFVLSYNNPGNLLDISHLKNGIYFFKIQEGDDIISARIVKE
ncbi:MAG: T9SS type A sorting domain-containing protein [Saprospiraceae bacterium]